MAANKRVRSRRPKNGRDLALHTPAQTTGKPSAQLRRPGDIQSEIHRLECFIAAAPRMSRQQKLARLNYVPPHETEASVRKPGRPIRHLPLQQQWAVRRRRLRLVVELGMVGLAIAGLAGWLNHSLHLFP